ERNLECGCAIVRRASRIGTSASHLRPGKDFRPGVGAGERRQEPGERGTRTSGSRTLQALARQGRNFEAAIRRGKGECGRDGEFVESRSGKIGPSGTQRKHREGSAGLCPRTGGASTSGSCGRACGCTANLDAQRRRTRETRKSAAAAGQTGGRKTQPELYGNCGASGWCGDP